jgi:hypothetical protein
MGGACTAYGEGRGMYRVLVGKPEGKRPLERPRRRWEDNMKAGLQEVGKPYNLHVPSGLKSVSLNLLEPSRPVQACKGLRNLYLLLRSALF